MVATLRSATTSLLSHRVGPSCSRGPPGETSQQQQGAHRAEEMGRPSGSPDPWAATAKIGSLAWAEGQVLGSLQLVSERESDRTCNGFELQQEVPTDMASRRRSQARQLIEQQDESEMPAQAQVQEEVSTDESVAQPQGAVAAAGGQQQQEYQAQPQKYAYWAPMFEQFFRAMHQRAWQPGQAAAGVQPPVPPPAVPEQQQVEQPERQQRSGTGSTRAGRQRTAVTEDWTALLERFLHLRPPMFHGKYDPGKAESWTHELERIFETMECAEEDQECVERFIAGLRPDMRWGVTSHMCTTLGEAVAKATALDRETWQPQQQQQGGASSRSSPYQHPAGSHGSATSSSSCSGSSGSAEIRWQFRKLSTRGGGRSRQQKRQSRFAEQSVV
ncbi:hypothetical protein Taro_045831 [Colocasia esculenta]|uniref:Retrotransposon gag domain-containing protein n=1 Tax=Colocasia esculenta TaxID=4460 RepID=A0A843WN76_COLES|nr:hypothetical protein [Colocasia esculenta]